MSDAPEDPPADSDAERVDPDGSRDDGDGTGTARSHDDRTTPRGESEANEDEADDAPSEPGAAGSDGDDAAAVEELRRQVDEKYDFENFGPADMAEMTVEEWEAAFDPDTWITGEALLDRVENDLASRVASREVFARVERRTDPRRLVAYSDEGYAVVYPDGSVTGEGTVLRDVKPSVALSSMESYDVPEPPEDATLPDPDEVPEQSGELGNLMLQVVAGMQVVAALVLVGAGVFTFGQAGSNAWLLFAAGIGFLVVGLLLFFTVANARLSDAFRAEEYRNRLRAVGSDDGDRPDFLPPEAGGQDDRRRSRLDHDDEPSGRGGADGTGDDTAEATGAEVTDEDDGRGR